MRCPECQSNIRSGIKFCEECGCRLETTCPACKAIIPLGIKFCGECGSKLNLLSEYIPDEISFAEKLRKIQKHLPKGLTEKIISKKEKIEGERKQVTVLFCDMQGFTTLVDFIGAEKAFSIMDQIYELTFVQKPVSIEVFRGALEKKPPCLAWWFNRQKKPLAKQRRQTDGTPCKLVQSTGCFVSSGTIFQLGLPPPGRALRQGLQQLGPFCSHAFLSARPGQKFT